MRLRPDRHTDAVVVELRRPPARPTRDGASRPAALAVLDTSNPLVATIEGGHAVIRASAYARPTVAMVKWPDGGGRPTLPPSIAGGPGSGGR